MERDDGKYDPGTADRLGRRMMQRALAMASPFMRMSVDHPSFAEEEELEPGVKRWASPEKKRKRKAQQKARKANRKRK